LTVIAEIVINELELKDVEIKYGTGSRGWVGDSPFILLGVKKIQSLGWAPKVEAKEAIRRTISWLKHNQWALEERHSKDEIIVPKEK
jgi:UDP-glucose 4-epimerase